MRRRQRKARKPVRRYKRKSNLAVPRGIASSPNQAASLIESVQYVDTYANMVSLRYFTLQQFYRATFLATNYKWYKAVKCTWTYEPLYNTFQENAASMAPAVGKPQILFQMNRTQDNMAGLTAFDIYAMGSKPQSFTANKVISYVPNWCSPGLTVAQKTGDTINNIYQTGLRAQTTWLASPGLESYNAAVQTTPLMDNTAAIALPAAATSLLNACVPYNGHIDFVDQQHQSNSTPVYRLTLTVKWLFKEPMLRSLPPRVEAKGPPVTVA